MPAVFGTPTATYRVAVPRKALQHAGAILMGIEVSVNGTKTCSRNSTASSNEQCSTRPRQTRRIR